jgi:hypothetical protein
MLDHVTGNPMTWLADGVLGVHLTVIALNLFGLVAIPLGALFGWRWVRVRWWRWLHLASMAVVAVQALAGQACFLTILQARLSGAQGRTEPLIVGVVNRIVFWPLPLWVFATIYLLLLLYVLALMRLVPPRPPGTRLRSSC